jgi:hypothetical protein
VNGYGRRRRSPHAALGVAVALFILVVLLDVGVTIWSAVWGAGLDDAPTAQSAILAVSDLRELLNDMVKFVGGILVGAFALASWHTHE